MNTSDFTENRFLKLIDNIDQRGTSQSDGVPFSPFRPFEDLSMKERAAVIRIGVQNGLRDLESIRSKYNEYADGGSIHIKPENRGKFTALKKRTGHSASWFKAHGTPAQKKMATFALNARKWKHEDGGILFGEGGDEKSVMLAESRENDVNWIDNWLHSRIPQMANNLDTYYNPAYEDISKKGLGYSADMKKINATNPHSLLPPMTYPMLSIGAKYPQIYKYIPFAENYRQDAAKRVIDSQVAALRNNTNVVDLRDPNVFATLNGNDPYALDFLKRYNKNGTLAANGTTYGASSLDGTNTIVISPFTNNKDVFLHEAVHSATHRYPIQNSAILKIFSDNKDNMYQPDVLYDDKMKNYLKTPTEVYSRLMEFRRHNNLDPSYKVTKEDLNKWRKDSAVDNKKLLDVFSDEVLLQLFNNVAHNNTLQDFREQFANQAALGGRLFGDGGHKFSDTPVGRAMQRQYDLEQSEQAPAIMINEDEAVKTKSLPEVVVYGSNWKNDLLKKLHKPVVGGIMNTARTAHWTGKIELPSFYGLMKNADNYDDPAVAALFDYARQEEFMKNKGYHRVDDYDYGLVNRAAKRHGYPPIYQLNGKDAISRDSLDVLTNDRTFFIDFGNGPEKVSVNVPLDDANWYPTVLYKHKDRNEYYKKGWDLEDFGSYDNEGGVNYKGTSETGNTYPSYMQGLANMLDVVGHPYVRRTPIIAMPELDGFIWDKDTKTFTKPPVEMAIGGRLKHKNKKNKAH